MPLAFQLNPKSLSPWEEGQERVWSGVRGCGQYVWKNSPWHLGGLSRRAHIPLMSWGYTGFNTESQRARSRKETQMLSYSPSLNPRAAKRRFLGRCVEALVAWSRGGSMEQWLSVEASELPPTWVRIPGPPLDLGPALRTN